MKSLLQQPKKGAIELSIGTIVIIVLGMTMLILGLILIRQIFFVANKSITSIDEKVRGEIDKQLGGEEGYIRIYTEDGEKKVSVKAGSSNFGVAIAARTQDGSKADKDRLQYRLSLGPQNGKSCIDDKYLGRQKTEDLFKTPLNKQLPFQEFHGEDKAYDVILLDIPSGTVSCTQRVILDVTDTKVGQSIGGNFFTLEITKGGFF
ncbi:hypothetical protein FJZ18_02290 [Candidatus Pacearchaeota archaeon]|nr:hypothetical protein [Candidatus Pacearchaeota archaeon]